MSTSFKTILQYGCHSNKISTGECCCCLVFYHIDRLSANICRCFLACFSINWKQVGSYFYHHPPKKGKIPLILIYWLLSVFLFKCLRFILTRCYVTSRNSNLSKTIINSNDVKPWEKWYLHSFKITLSTDAPNGSIYIYIISKRYNGLKDDKSKKIFQNIPEKWREERKEGKKKEKEKEENFYFDHLSIRCIF